MVLIARRSLLVLRQWSLTRSLARFRICSTTHSAWACPDGEHRHWPRALMCTETARAAKWLGASRFPPSGAPLTLHAAYTVRRIYWDVLLSGRHAAALGRDPSEPHPSCRRMIMGAQSAGENADSGDHGRARWQRRYDASRLRDAA